MPASAAYGSVVEIPGTSTATVGEACSLVSGFTYQITNAAKRVIDPTVAFTVKANGVAQAASAFTLDPLFGTIAFTGAPATPVTIDCNYLPRLSVLLVKEYDVEAMGNMYEVTTFDSGGAKQRMLGLKDWDGSLQCYSSTFIDFDPGAGTQTWDAIFGGGTPVLISIRPGGTGDYIRGWALLEKLSPKATPNAAIDFPVSFKGNARAIFGASYGTSFGRGQ